MKAHIKKIVIHTKKRKEIVNITQRVREAIDKSGIKEGIVLVNSMHITSSVFINDEEDGLKRDFMEWLYRVCSGGGYKHQPAGEDNADAHLKRTLMGREVVIAITEGKLDFGPWEQIFYGEFDGQRDKRVLIKVIGE